MKSIEIENVGPIEHASIPVLSRGGIVRMRGRNGYGKSTALAAVNALHSEDALVLTPRAGTQFGTIEETGGYAGRAKVKLAAAGEGLRGIEAYPGNARDEAQRDGVKAAVAPQTLEQRRGQAQEAVRRRSDLSASR